MLQVRLKTSPAGLSTSLLAGASSVGAHYGVLLRGRLRLGLLRFQLLRLGELLLLRQVDDLRSVQKAVCEQAVVMQGKATRRCLLPTGKSCSMLQLASNFLPLSCYTGLCRPREAIQ